MDGNRKKRHASANAKINIGLSIIGKRADGYHDLETLYYPVYNWEDKLEISQIESGFSMKMIGADFDVAHGENICEKAYKAFSLNVCHPVDGIHLKLHKAIPSGAGLGGGSADGASMLRLLNQWHNNPLSDAALKKIAAQLGSDVPFFMENMPAYATGRGENLEPTTINLSDYHIEIIKPPFSISTAEAYALVKPIVKKQPLKELLALPIEVWKYKIINDFEAPLFAKYSKLKHLKQSFYKRGAVYASLSGSGSAVYGVFEKYR